MVTKKSWPEARDSYNWVGKGRDATLKFQDDFRRRAGDDIEAWTEVAEWKLFYSDSKGTKDRIRRTAPQELLCLCETYMESPN